MTSPLDRLYAARNFKSRRISSYDRSGGNADCVSIEPGETLTLAEMGGAGIVKHIWCTISHKDPHYRRKLVLRMNWDDCLEPSVLSPIGDFFGQGWGEEYLFNSLPLAAAPKDGKALNCYFPMPYANGARITVENQSELPCEAFYYYVDFEEHAKMEDELRFHAWWNRELTAPMKGDENEWETIREFDKNPSDAENYLFVEAEGRGHYVGVNYFVDCPSPMWYGEGDDMFAIDGEPWPPRLHGTGTEDYFNSSWCPKELYQHPYFGYARVNNNIGWLGRTHCYRFHIEDPIVFEKSLRASIEHGHANCMTLDLCTVAYWYQTLPHTPFISIRPPEERLPLPPIDERDVHRWRHAWRKAHGGGPLWGNEEG